jgi:hypothetical protein
LRDADDRAFENETRDGINGHSPTATPDKLGICDILHKIEARERA